MDTTMNTPPIGYFVRRRGQPMPQATLRRQAWQARHTIVPPEVHAARAFARLANLDLDELGISGRPTCAQADPAAQAQKAPSLLQRSLTFVSQVTKRAIRWIGRLLR